MAVKELTKTQRTIALITVTGLFIYAIVNAFLVIYAYSKLSKNVDRLQDFVSNWKVGAITEIQAAASCSSGYEPLFEDRSWYGVDSGCYCGSSVSSADRTNYNITCSPFCSSSCSSTFTSKGCTNVAGRSAVELSYWGIVGSTPTKICIKRSKETWASQAPLLTADGNCPAGYLSCGTSEDYKFCTKELKCPITSITWGTNTGTCVGSNCLVIDNTGGNSKTLTFTRSNDVGGDGIPLAEFRLNEYGMCDSKAEDDITPSRLNFGLIKRKISTCNNEGANQWLSGSAISSVTEARLFQLHNLDTYIASLSPYTTSAMTGYYANSKTGNDYNWNLFSRNYIPFKNECREDMKSLLSKSETLTNLKTAQTALLVIGLISTAILGIALSYMEIQNLRGVDLSCIDGKGEAERKKLKNIKKIMTYAFKFLVIPFQIWAIALTGKTKGLFGKVGSGNCSNDMYNGIFSYFGDTLKSSYSSNITAIALTALTLLVDIVLAWWDDRKAKKEAQKVNSASVTNRHNNSEKEEIINLDNTVNMNSPVKTPNQPLNQQSHFASPGLSQPNSGGVVINIGGNGIAQQEVPQQAYAQQQFGQPQPQFAQPQYVQPQPQFAQPQYAQPQAQQNPFGQPQAQQNPFGQPQFAQQQYAPQQAGVQERSNPFGQR